MKQIVVAILPCILWVGLATKMCGAMEWWSGVDARPQQIGPNAWQFFIRMPVKPAGQLLFVGSQYDFASMTEGVAVDYRFNHGGMDFQDSRAFYAIAPTLFDPVDGFINGWDMKDLANGTFSGVVYSTAPLTAVSFSIAADGLIPTHGH